MTFVLGGRDREQVIEDVADVLRSRWFSPSATAPLIVDAIEALAEERRRRADADAKLAAVIKALDEAKAPTSDEHLDAIDRRGRKPSGYAPAGRVRAMYFRERIEANRQRQRAENAEQALAQADDLLRRLSEWDVLHVSPEGKPFTADAPYWQGEITRARDALQNATERTKRP